MWEYNYSYPSELYHYGVKGMKWGVRRTPQQLRYDKYSIIGVLRRNLPDVKTPNGVKVKDISAHAMDRIENKNDRKVTAREIMLALSNPMHISKERVDSDGRHSVQYIGRKATAVVNPQTGNIITVWKTGRNDCNKYLKEKSGGKS